NDVISGEEGKDYIYGQSGNDIINGGADKDYLDGSTGSDTYIFSLGDGKDYITDRDYNYNNTDVIAFNDDVLQEDIAIFIEGKDLKIDYGQNDLITVNKQTKSAYGIEEIRLDNGSYLTDSDINLLVQDLTAFASDNGIHLSNVQDVKNNEDLMNIVMNAWQS
ncbi:MAG: calcium-binding protein, partial [Vampirovibrionia bacterium]